MALKNEIKGQGVLVGIRDLEVTKLKNNAAETQTNHKTETEDFRKLIQTMKEDAKAQKMNSNAMRVQAERLRHDNNTQVDKLLEALQSYKKNCNETQG